MKNKNTYVIAEIGLNHNNDIKIAKKMIDVAKNSGFSSPDKIQPCP